MKRAGRVVQWREGERLHAAWQLSLLLVILCVLLANVSELVLGLPSHNTRHKQ